MVQNFQSVLENIALASMSKLVFSKANISKTHISHLLKHNLMRAISGSKDFHF